MSVIIINPNSTTSMTDAMVSVAKRAAPQLHFEGWTSEHGPAAIQGEADGAAATPHLLELIKRASSAGAEGIVIGCFDDTALKEAAQLAACPVSGIGQAAYHFAALRNWRFSVVTTLAVSVPILQRNIEDAGLTHHLGKVRASEVPVLELEANPERASDIVRDEALRAEAHDGVSAVILGCAGMVQVMEDVQSALDIEAIDPVECAARCMTWMI